MGDLIKDILDEIRTGLAASPAGPQSAEFLKDCFKDILPAASTDARMVFIDGGNAELIAAPSFCLHFIRIHHTVYADNSRSGSRSDEFYVLVKSRGEDSRIVYQVTLYPYRTPTLPGSFFTQNICIDSLDRGLCTGKRRLDISVVPGVIRRIAELSTALVLSKDLAAGDSLILDGDLESGTDDERKVLSALAGIASQKGIIISALAKTSEDLTRSGRSFISSLLPIAPDSAWYYPVDRDSSSDGSALAIRCFAKLHRKSEYIFRIEMFPTDRSQQIFPSLAANSADPVFLGYPYGLIDADRFARISNKELEYLRTMFAAKAGTAWKDIESQARARDAHSILDRISW